MIWFLYTSRRRLHDAIKMLLMDGISEASAAVAPWLFCLWERNKEG
jgi:hypothetical protein